MERVIPNRLTSLPEALFAKIGSLRINRRQDQFVDRAGLLQAQKIIGSIHNFQLGIWQHLIWLSGMAQNSWLILIANDLQHWAVRAGIANQVTDLFIDE